MTDEDKKWWAERFLHNFPGGINGSIPRRDWLSNPDNTENLSPLRPYRENPPPLPDPFDIPLITVGPRPEIIDRIGDDVGDPHSWVRLRFGLGCYEGDASELNWSFWEFWQVHGQKFLDNNFPSPITTQKKLFEDSDMPNSDLDMDIEEGDEEEEEIEEVDPMSEIEFFSFLREDRFLFANLQKKIREFIGVSKLPGYAVHQLGTILNILERFPISENWYSATVSTPDGGHGTYSISIEGDTIRFSRTYIEQSDYGSDYESSDIYEVGVGWREVDDYSEVRDFIAELFSSETLEIYAEDPPEWEFEPVAEAWSYAISKTEEDVL